MADEEKDRNDERWRCPMCGLGGEIPYEHGFLLQTKLKYVGEAHADAGDPDNPCVAAVSEIVIEPIPGQ